MRFLKRKILITPDREDSDDELDNIEIKKRKSPPIIKTTKMIKKGEARYDADPLKSKKRKRLSKSRQRNLRTKNIVKNYGKAIASFATSDLAVPYLDSICSAENVAVPEFVEYVVNKKEILDNIENLKNSNLKDDVDSSIEISFKKIFRKIAEVFLKYFSVNWIFSGRVIYKMEHLNFRGKMLRKIRNFDGLKSSKSHGKA